MRSCLKIALSSAMALAGHFSANASHTQADLTYFDSCYETEADAEKRASQFQHKDIDNSEVVEKEKRVSDLIRQNQDNVELSALKEILGEPVAMSFLVKDDPTLSWSLHRENSPSASNIRYDAAKGYCLTTYPAPTGGGTKYRWTPNFLGSDSGALTIHSIW